MDGFKDINFWEMILRTSLSFITILILARIIGKKQLSQLTFFHYITGITIGSIASEISVQYKTIYWDGFVSLIWWSLLTILISFLSLKFDKFKILVDDRPTILIQNGTIIKNGLKKARLNTDELAMLLREQGIFSFDEVLYAVFETNGQLSVLKNPTKDSATKEDVKVKVIMPKFMPTIVVSNGKILKQNLYELNLSEKWLMNQLKKENIKKIDEVYLAQVLEDGSLYIDLVNQK